MFPESIINPPSAAIQNKLIAAESLNISGRSAGVCQPLFQEGGEAEKIGVPQGYEPVYRIALGYKTENFQPQATPRNYEVVNYIR